MTDPPTIIRDNQTLSACYQQLQLNDIICGRIRMKPGEEHILTDLLQRGIHLIPSATSQMASRSKAFQAKIFSEFMLPGTSPVYDLNDLLKASSRYQQQQFTKVVLKLDRKNAGRGIHIFNNIEELYNSARFSSFPFPFVIQPYHQNSRDIRVVIVGDYQEAYERRNPNNFRNNLCCGGKSTPYSLTDQQYDFCLKAMQRGGFPYGHLDLILTENEGYSLMEINLRGGLKGARISSREYQERLGKIHEQLLSEL